MAECLEVGRPWPLLRTAGWGLAEAAGLPIGVYRGISALAGPAAWIIGGVAVVWLTVLVRKLATEFASVRHSGVNSPGLRHFFQRNTWLWAGVFAVLAAGFAGLVITEPIARFLIISTIITVALIGMAAVVSALWFGVVLKNNGLRLRFATA
jgi:hypothetical protein